MSQKRQEAHNTVWTDDQFRESPAFRGLTSSAILVLLDFHAKKQMKRDGKDYRLINNGELVYTYAEAEKRGFQRSTFQRALDLLIERGFLDVSQTGAGLYKSATRYALSNRWRFFGTPRFESATRPAARTGGGFKPGHPHYTAPPTAPATEPAQPCRDGRLKNVTKNGNGENAENGRFVTKNGNGQAVAVTKNGNYAVTKNGNYEILKARSNGHVA